ncbi:uncharacterized protein GlcG (DUF336 family) [Nocardia transvalensis]|uniref:Uncharacterized protein GlcG (DUF336 family) n=1 Tax=Nocardia transvalensis TaxID=37333 RepID=A0A7W9PHW0_9NOCA|nr:heme-binding protein [Nocardia transvalensis]MBB5916466.1 uncharacterized protein GlcG (DUF336 family) [Nocardia transvalensis]
MPIGWLPPLSRSGPNAVSRPLAVAVLDVTGAVIALRRADGGMPMTSRIAVAKARTALLSLQPSGRLQLPGPIVDSIQHLHGGDFVPFAGGILITDDETILGAAGASGAHATEDEEAVTVAAGRWREYRSRTEQSPAQGDYEGRGAR